MVFVVVCLVGYLVVRGGKYVEFVGLYFFVYYWFYVSVYDYVVYYVEY